ncbi:histidine phosphatase family protein [Streptomyces sp. KR80]|uniref:histidine phosphatase family protein n=1 Tax=Streptomyces sp. KR80 TaxID=3457426 RepID=UPI003FD1EC65
MTVRLTLVAAAASTALREVRFDDDSSLDDRAVRQARDVAAVLPSASLRYSAPSARCRETAAALGLDAVVEPALRDCDMGAWRGRTLDDLAATQPDALAAWTADPAAAPHGGESVLDLCRRVAAWLQGLPDDAGRVLAVTEPSVVRAAVVHALDAPLPAFWRIDVPPLSATRLTGQGGRWNLRLDVCRATEPPAVGGRVESHRTM